MTFVGFTFNIKQLGEMLGGYYRRVTSAWWMEIHSESLAGRIHYQHSGSRSRGRLIGRM